MEQRKTIEENGALKAIDTLLHMMRTRDPSYCKVGLDGAMKRNKRSAVIRQTCWILPDSGEDVVAEVAKDYPEVELTNMLVDNCAMQLVRDPKQFDVILTENIFGDILSG